jgi:peptidoglycan hydrolase CwlO-like protein
VSVYQQRLAKHSNLIMAKSGEENVLSQLQDQLNEETKNRKIADTAIGSLQKKVEELEDRTKRVEERTEQNFSDIAKLNRDVA